MRIERVVGNTFNEASERSRQLFGPSVMLISSARVGDVHELLVCTDASDEEASPTAASPGRVNFAANLQAEMAGQGGSRPSARVVPTVGPARTAGPAANSAAGDEVRGIELVNTIRSELKALEKRLAGNSTARGLEQKMALLEQGITASYASTLLEAGLDADSASRRLLEDLEPRLFAGEIGARPLLLVGPASSGRTTAAMQATHLVARGRGAAPIVSAVRDPRPGTREKFFAIADAAKAISSWGGVAAGSLVVDGGAYSVDDLRSGRQELSNFDVGVCIPSYLSRGAAARWLDCALPVKGVIITHWSDAEVPLGLLAALAERQIPLLGLSVSADPAGPMAKPDPARIGSAIGRAMSLVLSTQMRGGE